MKVLYSIIRGLKGSSYIFLFQSLSILLALALSALVARWGGVTAKGQFDLFTLWCSLVQDIGFLGLGSGLLAVYTIKKVKMSEIHGTGIFLSLLMGGFVALVGFLLRPLWLPLFSGISPLYLYLVLILSPLLFYRLVWINLALGIGKARWIHLYSFILNLLAVIILFILYSNFKFELKWALYFFLGTLILGAPFYFYHLQSTDHCRPRVSLQVGQKAFRNGIVIYFGFAFNILHFKIDQFMINSVLGTEALSFYALAARLGEGLFLIENAVVATYWAQIINPGSHLNTKLFWKVSFLQGAINLCAVAALYILGPWIMISFWGPEFSASYPAFCWLLPGIFIWSFSKLFANLLTYKFNFSWAVSLFTGLGLLLNLGLNYLMLYKFNQGIQGVAIASSISYSITAMAIGIFAVIVLHRLK
ncbi:MAG: hypothetical protein KDD34_09880 [Bdellovibrionales bacterium]|nr:hypothetical protein [Bdellovibrionales bacterium]